MQTIEDEPTAAEDESTALRLIVPLAAPLLDLVSEAEQAFSRHNPSGTGRLRPRDRRVTMLGSGYRAVLEGRPAAIVNLSMSGAQLRGAARVLPDQPAIVKIGWPLDDRQCAVLARV